ncbi:glycosyltransferase [Thalassobaculum sp. OXR-137]|uniref:glycosyltransferase n=1 Tax=Thalassobaculum sp. OXR-137 TaxID=3100173 RepID=UPI002AC8F4E6|nr:glycosyltransferase [Thalassobaculum sp. OXR-137]WPZ35788.1 glycosyltransferase [Thalassobaculum sp. OXR-137]
MYDYDVAVTTTASPPWLTGPAYLSLWQACGLAELGLRVAYVVPWVPPAGQAWLWRGQTFATPQEHLEWLAAEIRGMGRPVVPDLFHYDGHLSRVLRSIVPLEDVFRAAPSARVQVLTEPEHLCWYPWATPRPLVEAETVVGIVMTNYDYYISRQGGLAGRIVAPLARWFHRHRIRRHTDWTVSLSPAAEVITRGHPLRHGRVTGVLPHYAAVPPVQPGSGGAYFVGRLVWDKGLETVVRVAARMNLPIDILGEGPDGAAISALARELDAPVSFLGPSRTPWTHLDRYRVFFNPSLSENMCTTTAEALVAGRHVVMPECTGNEPFKAYRNAHFYSDAEGAVAALTRAMTEDPLPPDDSRREFDWLYACRTLAGLWEDAGPRLPSG